MWCSGLEHPPINQKITGLFPSQGTGLGGRLDSSPGHLLEKTDRCFSLESRCSVSLSLTLPFSLKSISVSLDEDKKKLGVIHYRICLNLEV